MFRELGRTGLKVSSIAFGSWQIGGTDWGAVTVQDARDAINEAFDRGINFIDTADCYGAGRSEEIIGMALTSRRKDCVVATKGGIVKGRHGLIGYDASPGHLRRAVSGSLRRLRTSYIDLYQLHWPDPKVRIEDSIAELARIQQEGSIRHIGVSNCSIGELERACSVARIESLQPSYNMFYRGIEMRIIDFCGQQGISIMPYNPLARGLLAGGYSPETRFRDLRRDDPMFNGKKYLLNLEAVELLRAIAAGKGVGLLSLVLSWTLRFPEIASVIVGIRNNEQAAEIAGVSLCSLDSATEDAIEDVLLRRSRAIRSRYWYKELAKALISNTRTRAALTTLMGRLRAGRDN